MNSTKTIIGTSRFHCAFGISILLCSILLLGSPMSSVQAQTVSGTGTTAAAFLKIGVGARALAMGEACATQAEDITALYWNPAGLARLQSPQILVNHFDYLV